MKSKQYLYYSILLFVSAVVLSSCNYYKHVPKNDKLYDGADIKFKNTEGVVSKKQLKTLKRDLVGLTSPQPNTELLGWKYKLYFYNISGDVNKEKGLGAWIRKKLGEPPVLASRVNLENNEDKLTTRMENYGFFRAYSEGETDTAGRQLEAHYTVEPGPQYTISRVLYDTGTSVIKADIRAMDKESLIKPKKPYNLQVIKAERSRIDRKLKEKGYYYFSENYLLAKVDTTEGNKQAQIYLKLKPETPQAAREQYRLRHAILFPNFTIRTADTSVQDKGPRYYESFHIIDSAKSFKPILFEHSIKFDEGDLYSRKQHNLTLNRLINLGNFKFVKNKFELTDSARTLDALYFMTPLARRSINAELQGNTKTNNLTGTNVTIGFKNRNLFRAGEQFSLDLNGGIETQISGQQQGFLTYRVGTDAHLTVPRFLIPFFQHRITTSGAYVPKTKFGLGYELLTRQKLYTLNSFNASIGYIWKEEIRKTHELNPISILFVQPTNVSQLYRDSATNNPTLNQAIRRQFILGTTYQYTFDGQLSNPDDNNFYLQADVDLSGNLAGALQGENSEGFKTILGGAYEQFVKTQLDVRFYHKMKKERVWANRMIAGVGMPYGNSTALPFIKQFFSGGNNSLRAFRSRSVGPGTYNFTTDDNFTFLPDQGGDFKFELNSEFRAKLAGFLHGAVFVDAGNVWLRNDDPDRPGAQFSSDWYNELAVGTGVGLRFDFSILILRTDFAMPIRKPFLADGNRWVFDQIKFGDPSWRRDNLIFNLAIGYPF